ncbi:KpsF/GutQ family sugar-phosphate isomerase [Granulicella arctica]|uniref:Arabinose-5-phosphate isomerase n=1 Tax=Granulicella arctica TaxID=940613 RepID=A0A7Y9PJG3_9BACT|nr:KpsF/GutQ family sugar-phosphate isomerase [Granulicella arctica]NYF81049.1 arabinose-5-phosphate isomerase [Granulicella arctica]
MSETTANNTRHDSLTRTLSLEIAGLVSVRAALDGSLGERLLEAVELILSRTERGGRTLVTGVGKSGHIGRKIAATLTSTGSPAHFLHAGEAGHGDLGILQPQDIVLAISWSGETPELAPILDYTRRFHIPLIALTSSAASALGSVAEICLELPAMQEACPNGLAPTTSTTMQLAVGDALAVCLLEARGFSSGEFHDLHPAGRLGARLRRANSLMHTGDRLPLVREGTLLSAAIVEMTSKGFGVTAVLDTTGKLTGIVTDGDLRRTFKAGFTDRPVEEAMTLSPWTIDAHTLAPEILFQMNARSVTTVFVLKAGEPIGILHIHDLLRIGLG